MDRPNCTRNSGVLRARSLIAVFVLCLPFIDSCSHPASPQEQPTPSVTAVQSGPSKAVPQPHTQAAVPFAVLAPAPKEVAIPGDAHRLDEMLQSGHSSSISALAFSRDGKWLASGGLDSSI